MLKVNNLVKLYPNAKRVAVNNISFELKAGEICGFLGMNGAGKSTTIKSVTGIIPYTSGEVLINGKDLRKDSLGAKMQFGFVPDNYRLYEKLTGNELVNYTADIYKIGLSDRKKRIGKFVELFKLGHAMNNQIQSYSHGMKQKICIISTLVHSPKLWLLDEPMVGLDPQSIFEVKEYMKEHAKKEGNTVFFSSHSLDTVQGLCDRAIIINAGRVLDTIDINAIKDKPGLLEKHFLNIVNTDAQKYKQELDALEAKEKELAKKYGKLKANTMIIKQVAESTKQGTNLGVETNDKTSSILVDSDISGDNQLVDRDNSQNSHSVNSDREII